MKKVSLIFLLLLFCFNLFSEITWQDAEENDEGITAYAVCTTKKEVLEITHWKDLDPYFISYTKNDVVSNSDFYLVIFMNIGTIVYEYRKGSKSIGYYIKTIFE